ncbi:MAG: inner membrane CreD family protein [bacterium]
MANPKNQQETYPQMWQQHLGYRSVMLIIVALIMSIPWYAWHQFSHHQAQQNLTQQRDLANRWGLSQQLQAPILVIPYVEHSVSVDTVIGEDGTNQVVSRDEFKDRTAIFLPSVLEANIHLKDQYRYQNNNKSLVYVADLDLNGQFDINRLLAETKNHDRIKIEWHKAYIALGLSETKSIRQANDFLWNEQALALQSGTQLNDLLPQGLHIPLKNAEMDEKDSRYTFNVKLSMNGSQHIQIAPFGAETHIHITTPWQYTQIKSAIPADEWINDEQGLSAKWHISHLVRNYPQYWLLEKAAIQSFDEVLIGVELMNEPTTNPYLTMSLQWGLVILGFIFLIFFVVDLLTNTQLHWVQYVILGLIVQSFFVLLKALEPEFGFRLTYYIASAISLFLIYFYALVLFRRFFASLFVLLLSAAVYATFYALLYYENERLLIITAFMLSTTFLLMLSSLRAHRTYKKPQINDDPHNAHSSTQVLASSEKLSYSSRVMPAITPIVNTKSLSALDQTLSTHIMTTPLSMSMSGDKQTILADRSSKSLNNQDRI